MKYLLSLSLVLVLPAMGAAAVIHVPIDYLTIQEAIDAASNGDEILVAPGTYLENIDFLGKAILVRSDNDGNHATMDAYPENTVIDGGRTGTSTVTFNNGEGPNSILQGFTIKNGFTDFGAGIYCEDASPKIIKNIISGNDAIQDGGGIYVSGGAPAITDNTFNYNITRFGSGGAIYSGLASPTLENNLFFQNESLLSHGGGVYIVGESASGDNPVIASNTFKENVADYGGAIACYDAYENGNPAPIVNNFFLANRADDGGAIHLDASSPNIVCNTFTEINYAYMKGGAIYSKQSGGYIAYSIFWDNEGYLGKEIYLETPLTRVPFVWYNNIEGGYTGPNGKGNINQEPGFIHSIISGFDYHLFADANSRDRHTNVVPDLPAVDFEGDPRPSITGGKIDVGADEFHMHLYHMGGESPGAQIEFRVIGDPNTSPVLLYFSYSIYDPPVNLPSGLWYLEPPLVGPIDLIVINQFGFQDLLGNIPTSPPAPYDFYGQAYVGTKLTNLDVIEVR